LALGASRRRADSLPPRKPRVGNGRTGL